MNKTQKIRYSKKFLLDFREENKSCPIQLQEQRWKLLKSTSSETTSLEEDTKLYDEIENTSKILLY